MSNKTKDQIIEKIKQEIPFIDVKPFSHNIISLELRLLEEKYGEKEVYNLINSNGKFTKFRHHPLIKFQNIRY